MVILRSFDRITIGGNKQVTTFNRTRPGPRLPVVLLVAGALATSWLVLGSAVANAATTNVNCPPYGAANLQSAIAAASPGDTLNIHGTCTGQFTVAKNLTLQGVTAGAGLNGNAAGTTLTVSGGVTVAVESLAVTNGKSSGDGGGIDLIGSGTTVNVVGSAISGNSTSPTGNGGGIDLNDANEVLTVSGSTVTNNFGRAGGGIALEGNADSVSLTGSVLGGNVTSTQGGGILAFGTAESIVLTGSSVIGNRAGGGGGIAMVQSGSISLSDSTVKSNTATGEGGGIETDSGSTVSLDDSTVSFNSQTGSSGFGGGGMFLADGDATLVNSTVTRNTSALSGGGINLLGVNGGTLSLTGSTVSFNTAPSGNGGGISSVALDGPTTLTATSSQLYGNLARRGDGGAIYNATFVGAAQVTLIGTRVGPPANTLNGNQAKRGGGIANEAAYGPASVALTSGSFVVANTASSQGGGIYNQGSPGAATVTTSGGSNILLNHPDNCSGC